MVTRRYRAMPPAQKTVVGTLSGLVLAAHVVGAPTWYIIARTLLPNLIGPLMVLVSLGFSERSEGSHHMFVKSGIEEQINIQREGSKAKPYQVKQVRNVIVRYKLVEESDAT